MNQLLRKADDPAALRAWIRDDATSPVRLNRTGTRARRNGYFEMLINLVEMFTRENVAVAMNPAGADPLPTGLAEMFVKYQIFGNMEQSADRMAELNVSLWDLHTDDVYKDELKDLSDTVLSDVLAAAMKTVFVRMNPWLSSSDARAIEAEGNYTERMLQRQAEADREWEVAKAVWEDEVRKRRRA